jgi:type II secretory pathway pseudopilin PulG
MAMTQINTKSARANREKGSSFIEILIALAILLILMIGILSMFSMACVVNVGAAKRTEQTFKCEQVMENLRIVRGLVVNGGGKVTPPANSGITFATGVPNKLPYLDTDPYYAYWGPGGANIVEQPNAPYRLFYRLDTDGSLLRVTVTAVEASELTAGQDPYTTSVKRRVEYVSELR